MSRFERSPHRRRDYYSYTDERDQDFSRHKSVNESSSRDRYRESFNYNRNIHVRPHRNSYSPYRRYRETSKSPSRKRYNRDSSCSSDEKYRYRKTFSQRSNEKSFIPRAKSPKFQKRSKYEPPVIQGIEKKVFSNARYLDRSSNFGALRNQRLETSLRSSTEPFKSYCKDGVLRQTDKDTQSESQKYELCTKSADRNDSNDVRIDQEKITYESACPFVELKSKGQKYELCTKSADGNDSNDVRIDQEKITYESACPFVELKSKVDESEENKEMSDCTGLIQTIDNSNNSHTIDLEGHSPAKQECTKLDIVEECASTSRKGGVFYVNNIEEENKSNDSSHGMPIQPDESTIQPNESTIQPNESTIQPNESNTVQAKEVDTNSESLTKPDEGVVLEESQLIQMNPQLREFDILDDLEGSENGEGEKQGSIYSDLASEGEEIPIDDLDAMLEEGLKDKLEDTNKENVVKPKQKVVLEQIGHDHFDLLPEGWIRIMHSSGMPVYLHQKSRVCTMSKPYYLGPGSSRNHKVPLSAIPCLQYRRALEVEKKNKEEREKQLQQNQCHPDLQLMAAKIETAEENEATQSLDIPEITEYCKSLFNFKTVTLIPFKSWADRRKFVRMTKEIKRRPTLPVGTKLLKFPKLNPDGKNSRGKGEWVINPNGKSYVCILHEYVQHALKKHPKYQFKELQNPATPYSATVYIGDMQYGDGVGASKKQAKVEAAKAALEVLIPEMKDKIERDSDSGMRSGFAKRSQNTDISIFDEIKIEDPRVAEFCAKTTEPPPYAILLTCLSRNMGLGEIKVNYDMNSKSHKEDEFTMTVGNHKATVLCKNKREGKQRAAQAILKALHPNIIYWGSLLRMYGNRSIKNVKEKKQEEQEITGLQSKAALNQPNYAILDKLKTEMLKLRDKRENIKAKGKFTPPGNVILPSLSSTNLNKVNLAL